MKFSRLTLAVLLTLSATACGTHLGTPTPPLTEAEADANLAARLEQGARVKKQIGHLRDAFRKADEVARTLGFTLRQAFGQAPGDALIEAVDEYPRLLATMSGFGVVRMEPDGSWQVEAPLPGGLSLGDLTQCPTARVRLTGKKVLDQEDVVLYLTDCEGRSADRLAKWIVHPDASIEMSYWPLTWANRRVVEGRAGAPLQFGGFPCALALLPAAKEANIACGFPLGRTNYLQQKLAIRDVPRGTAVSALFKEENRSVQIELEPHQSPRITYCDEGGRKCRTL